MKGGADHCLAHHQFRSE